MVQKLSFGSVRENDSPFLLPLEKKNIEDYIFFCHKSSIFFLFGFCFLCENMKVKVLMLGPKNKMLVFFYRNIVEILDIGRHRHDIANQKSVGQKIKKAKSPIFQRNFESEWHARVGWENRQNIGDILPIFC